MLEIAVVCVSFILGFWAGKTFQTKDSFFEAVKKWWKEL